MAADEGYALGIDLGTTYSAAAVARGAAVEICTLGTTAPQIPSVVVLREDGEILTGEAAERRAASEPTRTAREFKRRLGDPVPVIVGTTPYGAEALMAHLLRAIVEQASAREGAAPAVVVLTHPANYGDYKTGLLREAARLAGVDLGRLLLVTEPEAAAIAYARQARVEPGEAVAVYDFGGGTFDAAVVRRTATGFELLGTPEGMERLGGIDVDQAVLAHVDGALGGLVSSADGTDAGVRAGQARLRDECRRAKEALSDDTDTSIPVSLPGIQTEVRLTRDELETMVRPRVGETVQALDRAIRSAGLGDGGVSRVLLVGGSSRMPLVAQLVREATGVPVAIDAHPKFAIATGAALLGAGARPDEAVPPAATGTPTTPTPPTAGVGTAGVVAGATAAGFGATVVGASVLGADAAAAATGTAAAIAGPAGVPLAAAGPVGTPLAAAGPGGTPLGPAGPSGTPLRAANTARKGLRPLFIGGGVAAGVAAAAVAVIVLGGGHKGDVASVATTVATTPVTQSATTATTTAAAATTTTPVTSAVPVGRGLDGIVETVAGNGTDDGAGRPGPATEASLGSSSGARATFTTGPGGDVYAIAGSPIVLLVHDGTMTEIYHGTGSEGAFGGIAIGPDGDAYVTMNIGVKRIAPDGSSELVVDAAAEGLSNGFGPITFDGVGNMYFASEGTRQILRRAVDGSLSLVAGSGTQDNSSDGVGDGGPATAAPLGVPVQLAIDGAGNLLIADTGQGLIRSVSLDGTISTIAGGGSVPSSDQVGRFAPDGTAATDVDFGIVTGVAVDDAGRVYVADGGNHAIFRFGPDGSELVVADQTGSSEDDGLPANQTRARNVGGLAVDDAGDFLYFDTNRIKRIIGAAS